MALGGWANQGVDTVVFDGDSGMLVGAVSVSFLPCSTPILSPMTMEKPLEYVLIIHAVQDYDAWKQVFDAAAAIRREAGEQSFQVLRYDSDANKVVHFSQWESIAQAKAFFESPRLVEIRQQAGVQAPEFIYLQQLEAGTL